MEKHTLYLDERQDLKITGVVDVGSFDEEVINVNLATCAIIIKGKELGIVRLALEDEEIKLSGQINSITYVEKKKDKIMKRLLK